MILSALCSILILAAFVFGYMQLPIFGKAPDKHRLAKYNSPNFRNGQFQNQSFTPQLTPGYSMWGVLYKFIFKKTPGRKPLVAMPSVKTDLKTLGPEDFIVWFGHSSYLLQVSGKRFLVDPVFSGNASPLPGTNKSFKGSDLYSAADMPTIDYLVITHDHYDHLDYATVKALRPKVSKVITALGVGSHLERWGFPASSILEADWNQHFDLLDGIKITCLPSRHFSGRGFKRNSTLWASFLLQTEKSKIYLGGDSGYDSHFEKIGKEFGPIDLAILEAGQYDDAWHAIHMHPQETVKAATDLKAKRLFPVHSSKFVLANHTWKEPLERVYALKNEVSLVTPMIGQPVFLDANQEFSPWWQTID